MRKFRRVISTVLLTVMLLGMLPIMPISAATVSNPFDSTVVSGSTCTLTRYNSSYTASTISTKVLNSVSVSSATTFGSNEEVTLYDTTIRSTGNRKMAARSTMGETYNLWAESFNAHIAIGGEGARLFTYSMPCSKDFQNGYVEEIAKAFEADHPEWSVAVVTNGSFFKYTAPDSNKGIPASNITSEPEDVYIEDGKTYDTYIEKGNFDNCKVGRGVIGIKSDGTPIHYTLENGTTNYSAASTAYSWNTNYTLEVLGANKNTSVQDYSIRLNGVLDYTNVPKFLPTGVSGYVAGGYVYKIKCTEYKKAYIGVNGDDVSTDSDKLAPTYFFEGTVQSYYQHILDNSTITSTNATPPSGYVYVISNEPLEYLEVGTTVRGQRKMSTSAWKDVKYAFGFKQHILLNGEPLFDNAFQEKYSIKDGEDTRLDNKYGSWNAWTEDVQYATYSSNRTAVGFKANGDPVLISIPRTQYYTEYSSRVEIGPSYHEVAWYMKSLGCVNAFMMDCGGSVHMSAKNPTTGVYYDVVNNPGLTAGTTIAERMVYNALIIAYPSGKAANPTDASYGEPTRNPTYIKADSAAWYGGIVPLRSKATVADKVAKSFTWNEDEGKYDPLTGTNYTVTQSGSTYTLTPTTSTKTSYKNYGIYAYKKLNYTIGAGKHYTYCFKAKTHTEGLYCSILFAEKTGNTSTSKMFNNFASFGGGLSDNGDTNYSDVRLGYGRLQSGTHNGVVDIKKENNNIDLYLTSNYSMHCLYIDGTTITLKSKHQQGKWLTIGTLDMPDLEGAQLIFGLGSCFNGDGSASGRNITVTNPCIIDRTAIEANLAKANALTASTYTSASWSAVQTAVKKAGYAKTHMSPSYITYVNNLLVTAMNNLVKQADYDAAVSNKAEYENLNATAGANSYTTESWNAYTEAYNNLASALTNNNLSGIAALNSAYDEAKANLVAASVSLDVAWQAMSFTYETDSARWDPETHTYVDEGSGSSSGWVANDNSNVIELTNNSNIALDVGFNFSRDDSVDGISGISGAFYSNDSAVTTVALDKDGAAQSVSFMLEGAPTASLDNVKCGTVTLTVTRRKE